MSRFGLQVAVAHAAKLPTFRSLDEARETLIMTRDSVLSSFLNHHPAFDLTPESLKALERWYLEDCGKEKNRGYSVSHAIGYYYGEVYVRHGGFRWVVRESAFGPGHFELGVKARNLTIMVTNGMNPRHEGNARMQSMWREFQKFVRPNKSLERTREG